MAQSRHQTCHVGKGDLRLLDASLEAQALRNESLALKAISGLQVVEHQLGAWHEQTELLECGFLPVGLQLEVK
jgi:hypothetical protein